MADWKLCSSDEPTGSGGNSKRFAGILASGVRSTAKQLSTNLLRHQATIWSVILETLGEFESDHCVGSLIGSVAYKCYLTHRKEQLS